MEATSHSHESHDHTHTHDHDHGPADWNDEEFIARWLEHEAGEAAEHREQYVTIRALLPKLRDQEFSYINLGAGNGGLDKVLLEAFPNAEATLVDGSLAMLGMARKELERFGDRVEYVQANLRGPEWLGAVSGSYDFIVSTIALHHVGDAQRVRELYGECFRLLGHGGMFLNLDLVRAHRAFDGYGVWASRDAEAALNHDGGEAHLPGTLIEHLGWLSEAGFTAADVVWKDMNVALFVGLRDHLHLPEAHTDADEHSHSHSHGEETHSHSHEHDDHSHGDHDHDHADHDHDSHSHDEHDHEHGEHHHH